MNAKSKYFVISKDGETTGGQGISYPDFHPPESNNNESNQLILITYHFLLLPQHLSATTVLLPVPQHSARSRTKILKGLQNLGGLMDLICQDDNPGICAERTLSEPAANLKRAKKSDSMA